MTAASGATTVPMSRPSATQSPVGHDRLLLAHQRRAHGGVGGDARRGLGGLGGADRLGDVAPVEQHALAELDDDALGDVAGRGGGVCRGCQTHAAIHRPGVQVRQAEPLRGATRQVDFPAPAARSMAMTMDQRTY